MNAVLTAAAPLAAALLFIVGVLLLGVAARVWADAIAAGHRAHSHAIEVRERKETYQATHEALEDAEEQRARARAAYVPPNDRELYETILAEREANRGNGEAKEYTTTSNEGLEEEPPIRPGGLYNT